MRGGFFLRIFQFVNFFGDVAVGLVDAIAVAAIHFFQFAIANKHRHHTAGIQLTAITAAEFLDFHSLILQDAEASGAQGQAIIRHNMQIIAQQ